MEGIIRFLAGSSPAVYVFIFLGKLIEVGLASLRSQLIIKGQRVAGAITAVFEYTLWLCITGSAMSSISNDPWKMVTLIAAFALGQVLGSVLEEKLALGYSNVSGIFMDLDDAYQAAEMIRESGQAVTLIPSEGLNGARRLALCASVRRKDISEVASIMKKVDEEVVLTVQSLQKISGAKLADSFAI